MLPVLRSFFFVYQIYFIPFSFVYCFVQGFEHLLENIGLGNIEFSVNHTIDEHRPAGYKVPNWNEMDAGDNLLSKEALWHEIVFKKLHESDHAHMRAGSKIRTPSGNGGESCELHILVYLFV